jgi:hypothetical protein
MSSHHSFDVNLAAEFGIEEAIIIHHFQHWVRFNRDLRRNNIEGRTWTYQTLEEVAAHFPYLNKFQVHRIIQKLIEKKILISGNFNKTKYDQTLWYSFIEEEKWVPFIERLQFCNIQNTEMQYPDCETATPIPHTIPHTIPEEEPRPSASPPSPPSSAQEISALLAEAIRKTKPDIKLMNPRSWERELEKMIRIDKRNLETTKKIIEWLPTCKTSANGFNWNHNILSAQAFRKQFDKLELACRQDASKNDSKGSTIDSFASEGHNRALGTAVARKHHSEFIKRIITQCGDYMEFTLSDGREYKIYYKDAKFRELVLHELKKRDLSIEGL